MRVTGEGHTLTTGEGQSHSCNYCRKSSSACDTKLHIIRKLIKNFVMQYICWVNRRVKQNCQIKIGNNIGLDIEPQVSLVTKHWLDLNHSHVEINDVFSM